ncbi:MAG: cellulase family glycosylhydrolase [Bacteroidota bacterium]
MKPIISIKKNSLTILFLFFFASAFSQTLSPLSVSGDKVVDASGKTVILRGCVTITHDGPSSPVIYTAADYKRLKAWGANYQSIRLFASNIGAWGIPYKLNEFLDTLDTMVYRAKQEGIYTEFKLTMYGAVGFKWEDLWANANGEQNKIINGWKNIWNRYKNEPAVIGYDLLNEPERGNVNAAVFVCNHLNPFYQKMIDELQIIDNTKMALIQSAVYLFAGQVNSLSYNCPVARQNVIYAPHFYVKLSSDTTGYAARIKQYNKEALMHNSPLLIGEFGVPWDTTFDGDLIKENEYMKTEIAALSYFDSLKIGFSRPWFSDDNAQVLPGVNWALIKGSNGLGGPERKFILDVISRPYPQYTAGNLISTKHDINSKRSVIKYTPNPALGSTTIFIPRKRHFNDSLLIQYNALVIFVDTITNSLIPLCNPDNYNLANFTWNANTEILTVDEWQSNTATIIIGKDYFCPVTTELEQGSNVTICTIYPNPFTEEINIIFNRAETSDCNITIYDIRGKIIFSDRLNDLEKITTGEKFSKGVYFIELKSETGREIIKVVKI